MNADKNLLNWKGNDLYYGNKKTGYSVLPEPMFSNVFWVLTPQGNSLDFYNLSRAKQHCKDLYTKDMHKTPLPETQKQGF